MPRILTRLLNFISILSLPVLLLGVVLASLSACSSTLFSSAPTAEVREVLVNLSTKYLGYVVLGDEAKVQQLVFWEDFLGSGSDRMTRDDFHAQFEAIKGRWPQAEHPLMGLQIVDISQRGNVAVVRLRKDPKSYKAGTPDPGEIRIQLVWGGTAWIIREDNLFGRSKYFAQFVQKSKRAS